MVVADAPYQHVLAPIAEDQFLTRAALYLVSSGVAVEDVVVAEALYHVAKGGRFVAAEAFDVVLAVGSFEGIRVRSALAVGPAGLGHPRPESPNCWASATLAASDRASAVAASNSMILLTLNLLVSRPREQRSRPAHLGPKQHSSGWSMAHLQMS